VDRETNVFIAQKILLEALPERVHQLELTRICARRKGGLCRCVKNLNRSAIRGFRRAEGIDVLDRDTNITPLLDTKARSAPRRLRGTWRDDRCVVPKFNS